MAGSLLVEGIRRSLICPAILPTHRHQYRITPAAAEACRFSPHWAHRIGGHSIHCASFGGAAQASVVCAPQQRTVNFYEVLGVSLGSSPTELKDAYRSMVKQYHPDRAPPEKVEEYRKKFMEVHRAYNMLKDPEIRSIYDFKIKNSPCGSWLYEEKTEQWRGRNWETDQCWTS